MEDERVTSRERVLLAIDHRKTDRAPADYGAHKDVTDRYMENYLSAQVEKGRVQARA